MKWPFARRISPCCIKEINSYVLIALLSLTVVSGSPTLSKSCVTGLQTQCAEEIHMLESAEGEEACKHLSEVVWCVSCKLPDCTDVLTNIVTKHSQPPFKCHLTNDDIALLQKGEQYEPLCQSIIHVSMASTTSESPENESQIQDKDGIKGNANRASHWNWLCLLGWLLLSLVGSNL